MVDDAQLTRLYRDALEALPEAIAVFDEADRFVFWNRRFAELYDVGADIKVGTTFVDHVKASLARGAVPGAAGREEAWLAERLARFAKGEGAYEHRLGNGRCVRVQDRRLPHGGTIGIRSDITELSEREQSFRAMFDANPVPMFVADLHSLVILAANDAALIFYGYPRDVLVGLTIPHIRPERVPGEVAAFIRTNLQGDQPVSGVVTHRTASGDDKIVRFTGRRLTYGGRAAVLAGIFDLTELHRAEREVSRARAFLTQVVDEVPIAVFAKDADDENRFVIYNRASESLFGRTRDEVIGRTDAEVFGPDAAAAFSRHDGVALQLGSVPTSEDETIVLPDGRTRAIRTRKVGLADRPGETPHLVLGVSEDVTEQRAREARIAHMAHHDVLTDLPNRFLFHERLASALARRQTREPLAVLFLDLDGFKAVNDTHGHAAGDELLRQVADRLRATLRGCDTAARFGGDEFAILQSVMAEPGEAAGLAARLVAVLAASYRIGARELRVSASVGVALATAAVVDPAALLEQADGALYRAKREGRNTFRFASGPLDVPASRPESATAA